MSDRKKDHIEMSFQSVPDGQMRLAGMAYEPMLSGHPSDDTILHKTFLGHEFQMPLWISSMTGGTDAAQQINQNLARACGEFGLGMGLGSCRPLLEGDARLADFDVKHLMGTAPLFTNFGIAQLEGLVADGALNRAIAVGDALQADGMVVHVNPLQEWAQAEGDRYHRPAIETISHLCEAYDGPVIVKEVGQGMGPASLSALLDLPIAAIELAGYGGTNFSLLERARQGASDGDITDSFSYIGHRVEEMIDHLNAMDQARNSAVEIIISGGVKDPLIGHVLMQRLKMNSVVGMASAVLTHAMGDYTVLQGHLRAMRAAFMMAKAFVKVEG